MIELQKQNNVWVWLINHLESIIGGHAYGQPIKQFNNAKHLALIVDHKVLFLLLAEPHISLKYI